MAKESAPAWIIVAGPNGAGKTTIAQPGAGGILRDFDPDGAILRLNADERARELEAAGAPPSDATNLRAAKDIDAALARAIDAGRSVAVETVLSSNKYRPLVRRARAAGFTIVLVYVCLRSPELSARRVRRRVKRGGHDVPPDRIARRWAASLENLEWFGLRADSVFVFDNSGRVPKSCSAGHRMAPARHSAAKRRCRRRLPRACARWSLPPAGEFLPPRPAIASTDATSLLTKAPP